MTDLSEGGILIGTVFGAWWKSFINLVYPLTCLVCGIRLDPLSEKPLCEACFNKIEFNPPPFCRRCGKHLPAESQEQAFICKDCQRFSFFFSCVRSVCLYDGIIKECIHLFKYKGKLSLVKPLSKLMIDFAYNFLDLKKIDSVLPVPLYKARKRQRQFNQAYLLASSISREFSKELNDKQLIKIKPTPAQINLSRIERLKNVRGAFKVKNPQTLKNKNILLIDDVFTTGATVNECAKILQEAGVNKIDVLTLARSE